MENTPINLGTILEQARDWTFDGDFQILQWMNKISQNLEARATKTTENFDRLNNNVKSTHVALDNVTNSLTALQYGNQFVECRVQDDDETSMSGGNEGIVTNGIATPAKPSSKEILTTFLDNNLKVLRNCHEKYSIDLDDSDEEDDKVEKTYIFQPINPYNEKPLPHIFGSKEWCDKWHVGLGYDDQDNSYSGDELSEAYSESSSCSAAPDNESYESNSEFASSISLNNDNFAGSKFDGNVSTLRRSKLNETVSETSSTHSSAARLSSTQIPQNHDLIEEIQAASSSLSSSQSKTEDSFKKLKHSQATNAITKPHSNIPPYVDLFAEPPDDLGSTPSTPSLVDNILHKPVNFFNDDVDDVFKHLAIAQSKRTDPPPVARERTNVKAKSNPIGQTTTTTDQNKVTDQNKGKHSAASLAPTHNLNDEKQVRGSTSLGSSRTPKSLFDDEDDDDEDFLSAFVKKQKSFGNPKLLEKPGYTNTFSNSGIKDDIFKDSTQNATANSPNEISVKENLNSNEESVKTQTKFINLFDDVGDEDLNIVTEKPSNIMASSIKATETSSATRREKDNTSTRSLASIIKSTNIFDDDDDDDDFFKTLPSIKSSVPTPIGGKDFRKTMPSIDLLPSNQTESNNNQIIKSSSVVGQNEGLNESNPAIDTDKDFIETLSRSSAIQSQSVLTDSYKDDDDLTKTLSPIHSSILKKSEDKGDLKISSDLPPIPSSILKKSADKGDLKISSDLASPNNQQHDDDLFGNLQSIRHSIPTQTVDNSEEKTLQLKSKNIEASTPGSRKIDNQSLINNLFDDVVDKDNVVALEHTETLQIQTDSEDLNVEQKSMLKSRNIFEDSKDSSEKSVIPKTENVVDGVKKTGIESKTKSDEYLAQMVKEQEISFTSSDDIHKTTENQESLLNKDSQDPQNITPTAEAVIAKISDSENEKTTEHLTSYVENPAEQLSRVNSLNIQKNPAAFTDELFNVNAATIEPRAIEEVLNKTTDMSKDEKKSQKYDLNSSFLFDEPPDDDDDNEFFESLGKTSSHHQSITKYNSFDLENDLYPEPQLPKIPNAETTSSSIYTGLQLFDDIPPEDECFNEVMTQKKPETTKRLNTVFYDDFHETLEALNGIQRKSTHSISKNNENPPAFDNDKIKLGLQNKDVVDFLKPDLNDDETSSKTKAVDLKEEDFNKLDNKNRPISKLQLPKININVQTLLPAGGGIPPGLKMAQNVKKVVEIETVSNDNSAARTSEASHILPNVNKTRVRAPVNRRPSTRKARQENYRKSLLDEELEAKNDDDDNHEENNKNNSEAKQKLQHDKTEAKSNRDFINSKPKLLGDLQPSSKGQHISDNLKARPSTKSRAPSATATATSNPISIPKTLLFTATEEKDNAPEQIPNKNTILKKNSKLTDEEENNKDITNVITTKKSNETPASLQNDVNNQLNLETTRNPLLKSQLSNKTEAGLLTENSTKECYKTPLTKSVTKSKNELKTSTKMLFTDSESEDDLFANLSNTTTATTSKSKTIEPPERDKLNKVAAAAVNTLDTRKAPMNKPQTSLFGDDSDDDDDDFLKTTAKHEILSKNKPKMAAPMHPSKSIFSDIEDSDEDGDLFGGNSKVINKQPLLNTAQSNAAAESKQQQTTIKSTIADNPLADLL